MNAIQFFEWGTKRKRLSYEGKITKIYTNGYATINSDTKQTINFSNLIKETYTLQEIIFQFKPSDGEINMGLKQYIPTHIIIESEIFDPYATVNYLSSFLKENFDIFINNNRCSITKKYINTDGKRSGVISFSGSKTINVDEILEIKIQFK
jgi:hypothetical protein